MLDFIRSVYRQFVLIGFWVILIGLAIAGGVIGDGLDHAVVGVILGLIIGFVTDILVCGFIVTILNIDENIEYLIDNLSKIGTPSNNNSSKTGTPSNNNSSGINLSNVVPVSPIEGL